MCPPSFIVEALKQMVCAMHRQTGNPPRAVALPGAFEVGGHGGRKSDRKGGHDIGKSVPRRGRRTCTYPVTTEETAIHYIESGTIMPV